jgi:cytochrome c-type biogenesis protein CcmH
MMKSSICACISLLLVTWLTAGWAQAQVPAPDEPTYRIAKQLNCPTCAGRNLADCPTETCAQWKAEIKAQLDAGKSAEEVLAYFQDRFGPTVLQEPPKSGITAPLWAGGLPGHRRAGDVAHGAARRAVARLGRD